MGKKKPPPIRMHLSVHGNVHDIYNKEFSDWYDFADWVKQQNEGDLPVVIHRWEYAR